MADGNEEVALYTDAEAGDSDLDVSDSDSDRSFDSDTDSDDNNTQSTMSSLATDSEASQPTEDGFWDGPVGQVQVANFTGEEGPRHHLPPDSPIIQYFYLILGEDFFQSLADETNRYANQQDAIDPTWKPTTPEEMKAYIGLYILMGINRLPRYEMYWDEDLFIGNQGFQNTMAKNRYEKLTRYFHISDNNLQRPRNSDEYDRLHKIRPLINAARTSFKERHHLGKYQSIDEGMVRYKGDYFAKVYMPKKPIRRGLKVTVLSTTSDPHGDDPAFRRIRGAGEALLVPQPPPVKHYQSYMRGVDKCMQFRAKHPVGRSAKKWWKFFFRFILELSMINAHIIFKETFPGTDMPLVDFQIKVSKQLIGQFTSRKRRYTSQPEGIPATLLTTHRSVKLETPKGRCQWCKKGGMRRETRHGCNACKIHLCPGGCFQGFHNSLAIQD